MVSLDLKYATYKRGPRMCVKVRMLVYVGNYNDESE